MRPSSAYALLPLRWLCALIVFAAPLFAGPAPALDAFFTPGPSAFGLSPDGNWHAFAVRENNVSAIYTREPATQKGFKIAGIAGFVDQLRWVAQKQFVVRANFGAHQKLLLTDPSGAVTWDFTPPDYQALWIVENQPPPDQSGKLFFVAQRGIKPTAELWYLRIPTGGVTSKFDIAAIVDNELGIDDWLITPEGKVLGGCGNRGAERKLWIAPTYDHPRMREWKEAHSDRLDRFPMFTASGSPPGRLLAQGYHEGNYTSGAWFDLVEKTFRPGPIPAGSQNVATTVFSPAHDRVDGIVLHDSVSGVQPLSSEMRTFVDSVVAGGKIKAVVPLGISPDYQRALVFEQTDQIAPRYWYVDLKKKIYSLVVDRGEQLVRVTTHPMKPILLKARDGVELPCYWTEPALAKGAEPSIAILVPGGPFEGFHREWNGLTQALASRGVTVLTMNYRGNRGFGRNFYEAGLGEANRGMLGDVEDVLRAVSTSGTPWKRKIVIGFSFGGYAVARACVARNAHVDAAILINPLIDPAAFFRDAELNTNNAALAAFEKSRWYGETPLRQIPSLTSLSFQGPSITLVQSRSDERVPLETAQKFAEKVKESGAKVALTEIDDVHAVDSPRSWVRIAEMSLAALGVDSAINQ